MPEDSRSPASASPAHLPTALPTPTIETLAHLPLGGPEEAEPHTPSAPPAIHMPTTRYSEDPEVLARQQLLENEFKVIRLESEMQWEANLEDLARTAAARTASLSAPGVRVTHITPADHLDEDTGILVVDGRPEGLDYAIADDDAVFVFRGVEYGVRDMEHLRGEEAHLISNNLAIFLYRINPTLTLDAMRERVEGSQLVPQAGQLLHVRDDVAGAPGQAEAAGGSMGGSAGASGSGTAAGWVNSPPRTSLPSTTQSLSHGRSRMQGEEQILAQSQEPGPSHPSTSQRPASGAASRAPSVREETQEEAVDIRVKVDKGKGRAFTVEPTPAPAAIPDPPTTTSGPPIKAGRTKTKSKTRPKGELVPVQPAATHSYNTRSKGPPRADPSPQQHTDPSDPVHARSEAEDDDNVGSPAPATKKQRTEEAVAGASKKRTRNEVDEEDDDAAAGPATKKKRATRKTGGRKRSKRGD